MRCSLALCTGGDFSPPSAHSAHAQQQGVAQHPHELPAAGDTVQLCVDAAQYGLGSRACDHDVLPRDALWPQAADWEIVLR